MSRRRQTLIAYTAKRSLFNGLAMVLVQSSKEPGEIKLLATSDNLDPGWIILQSEPSSRGRFSEVQS